MRKGQQHRTATCGHEAAKPRDLSYGKCLRRHTTRNAAHGGRHHEVTVGSQRAREAQHTVDIITRSRLAVNELPVKPRILEKHIGKLNKFCGTRDESSRREAPPYLLPPRGEVQQHTTNTTPIAFPLRYCCLCPQAAGCLYAQRAVAERLTSRHSRSFFGCAGQRERAKQRTPTCKGARALPTTTRRSQAQGNISLV